MDVPIITITGTKGKTTTVNVVADVLRTLHKNVLKVDTTGHFVNGERRSTLKQASSLWGLVPSVSPGRYLYEFHANPELCEDGVAVLEASLGSSSLSGMGYRSHTVGVFLNVFEDHLGSSSRIQTKQDIADAKAFVFERIERGGWAICNADDPLVSAILTVVPDHLDVNILPCAIDFAHFDLGAHLEAGGKAITVRDNYVVLLSKEGEQPLVNLLALPWTFEAQFMPSVWNAMMAAAALYGYSNGAWNEQMTEAFESVRLDPYGGRLTPLRAANGAQIIADYAHEKVSLVEVAKLAKRLAKPGGKVIGIVRLANDRTPELIAETGRAIGATYDQLVVYDKIDGYLRMPRPVVRSKNFPEITGKISELLSAAIAETNLHVERIIREDQAVAYAADIAGPNDVVVYIVNDDIKRSIGFALDSFKAEFL
jgi:cyanophycin synthetase